MAQPSFAAPSFTITSCGMASARLPPLNKPGLKMRSNQISEIVRLREKVDDLKRENRELREALRPADCRFLTLGLTANERLVLRIIFDAYPDVARSTRIKAALHGPGEEYRHDLAVYVSKIRRKLAPLGVEIKLAPMLGYYMPPETKNVLDTVIKQEAINEMDG